MNKITLHLRRFPVFARDKLTGDDYPNETVTLEKSQLQAVQIVGQSSRELVERICGRKGWTAIEIGKPVKLAVTLDLDELWTRYGEYQDNRAKWNYLYGGRC